jgi:hypothetical protein
MLLTIAGLLAASLVHIAQAQEQRAFPTPEDAVRALTAAAKSTDPADLIAIFGPDSADLLASSDPATTRQNRETFIVAVGERWRLVDRGVDRKELVIGNEAWPFPVPLAKGPKGWVFDTAAGREEVLDRRIGRNELAVIRVCQTYAAAQRAYAARSHDGVPAGVYARRIGSTPGTQNGLYWPSKRGEPPSPLGDLMAQAADEGHTLPSGQQGPYPFHGYLFRILEAQGTAAPGGAKSYVVNGQMSGGFALIAWPVEYDVTGIMTFIVGPDGTVSEQDLGPETAKKGAAITEYNPDPDWESALPGHDKPREHK